MFEKYSDLNKIEASGGAVSRALGSGSRGTGLKIRMRWLYPIKPVVSRCATATPLLTGPPLALIR